MSTVKDILQIAIEEGWRDITNVVYEQSASRPDLGSRIFLVNPKTGDSTSLQGSLNKGLSCEQFNLMAKRFERKSR